MATVTARVLREAIGEALRDRMNSDVVEEVCVELGLEPPNPPYDVAFNSKRAYVVRRLAGKSPAELITLAIRVDEEHDAPELRELVSRVAPVGVAGQLKNLIFAADGAKPRIVLRDAINNDLAVVDNEQYCLVYDRPLDAAGLTWRALTEWWKEREQLTDHSDQEVSQSLYRRLAKSLGNDAEQLILRRYAQRYVDLGPDVPALIPQVYLHYDPYTTRELGPGTSALTRQRMDFLLLLPNRARVVIELDGVQHYADPRTRQADTGLYARMVAEDRQLRLRGYEVYRFGGRELQDPVKGSRLLDEFFTHLTARHTG
jgi:very-short-patch-repair endonuclease